VTLFAQKVVDPINPVGINQPPNIAHSAKLEHSRQDKIGIATGVETLELDVPKQEL
jgi:hypothetical protein